MPVQKNPDGVDLFELERRLDELAGYRPGGFACVQRAGRPWRLVVVHDADEDRIMTENGYVYARATGRRLVPDKPSRDELCPLTRERLEYLIVQAFLEELEKFRPGAVQERHARRLLPLARSFRELRPDLGQAAGPAASQAE